MSEKWNNWVKKPIGDATIKYENQASEQFNKYSGQAKAQIRKPGDYYWKQDAFYRGLFWIAVGLLIVLWILSGS
jgi:hypothetical protein